MPRTVWSTICGWDGSPDEAEATARAHALGLQPGLTYAPLTIRVVESVSADQAMAQGRLTRALDSVRHSVRGVGRTALTALRPTGQMDLILSLPASPEHRRDDRGVQRSTPHSCGSTASSA